ncbi:MAG: hypothetical protein ACKO2G_08340 [Verrucomicrobiales bacterium]
MTFPASSFSRVLALLALLLVVITMVCSGLSLEPGLWQKVVPVSILAGGAVLAFQLVALVSGGSSSISPNILWRMIGAFAFFASTFAFLIVIFPELMWEVTKGTNPLPQGIPAGVDTRLKDVIDISGPFSPAAILTVNVLLLIISFLGSKTEDANPELEPVT